MKEYRVEVLYLSIDALVEKWCPVCVFNNLDDAKSDLKTRSDKNFDRKYRITERTVSEWKEIEFGEEN